MILKNKNTSVEYTRSSVAKPATEFDNKLHTFYKSKSCIFKLEEKFMTYPDRPSTAIEKYGLNF